MKRYLILFLLIVCTGMAVFAQMDLQPVARVNLTRTEPITVRQLKNEIEKAIWPVIVQRTGRVPTAAELAREIQNLGMAERRQALDAMINEKLALQAAERDRIVFTDNELNQHITQLRTQMAQTIGRPPTEDEFALAIKNETGQDYPAFRESIRRTATIQKYLMTKKEDVFKNLQPPSEAEILSFYNLSKANLIRPDTVRFSMIHVAYGADARSKTRAKELADRLKREIGSDPSKFDEAVQKGQTPNSGYEAGEGGYLPLDLQGRQAAGADFISIASTLRQGEVSRVIEGNLGYQIIKITETLPQKALTLDDFYAPGTRITVRQYIGANMMQQRQMELVERATAELIRELRTGNPFQIMENNLNW